MSLFEMTAGGTERAARKVLRWGANAPFLRVLARHLAAHAMGRKIRAHLIRPPDTDTFRTILSETAPTDAVPGRVVMVCGSLQPGGAERQVANTLIGLATSPVESVTLLCDHLNAGTKEKYDFYLPLARQSGAPVRAIRSHWTKAARAGLPGPYVAVMDDLHPALAADVANLYFEFRELRPDVVHAWLDWSNVRAGLAAVLAGVPRVLLSGRNLSPRHFALNTDYFHPAYSALMERSADQVVLLNNSRAGALDYADWLGLPPERIKVIRNGVQFSQDMRPTAAHDAAFRARLGIPLHAPVVGGMFRFNPEKQPLLWLEVASHIAKSLPDAHFVIFGEGPLRAAMEDAIRAHGLAARTHLCGHIAPSLDGLSPCDLILFTSTGEGTPNVLLEAQWLGLPVVTTDAGGAGEAIRDKITGLVVRTNDPDAIADAAVGILRDPAFRETARREGPRFIAETYGMERMIAEVLSAYRRGDVSEDGSLPTQDAPLAPVS